MKAWYAQAQSFWEDSRRARRKYLVLAAEMDLTKTGLPLQGLLEAGALHLSTYAKVVCAFCVKKKWNWLKIDSFRVND